MEETKIYFETSRSKDDTITITRKKKNNVYQADIYVFSADLIKELKAIKPTIIQKPSSLISRFLQNLNSLFM